MTKCKNCKEEVVWVYGEYWDDASDGVSEPVLKRSSELQHVYWRDYPMSGTLIIDAAQATRHMCGCGCNYPEE